MTGSRQLLLYSCARLFLENYQTLSSPSGGSAADSPSPPPRYQLSPRLGRCGAVAAVSSPSWSLPTLPAFLTSSWPRLALLLVLGVSPAPPGLPPAQGPPSPAAACPRQSPHIPLRPPPAASHPEMFTNLTISDPFRTQQRSVLAAPLSSVPMAGGCAPPAPPQPPQAPTRGALAPCTGGQRLH